MLLIKAQVTSSQALRWSSCWRRWPRKPARSQDVGSRPRVASDSSSRIASSLRSRVDQAADPVVVGLEQVANGLAVDELKRLGQRRRLRPFTLAGQQAVGLAEDLEERPSHACPGQLRRVDSPRTAL